MQHLVLARALGSDAEGSPESSKRTRVCVVVVFFFKIDDGKYMPNRVTKGIFEGARKRV